MTSKVLNFKYMDIIDVNIILNKNYTVLNGNSATGKSYLYEILSQYALENPDENILCLCIDNLNRNNPEDIINQLRAMDNALIVIDQADLLFNYKNIENYIAQDRNNYYLIMSRKFAKKYTEWAKPVITKNNITIKYRINTI